MSIETYGLTIKLAQQPELVNSYVYSWRSPYIEAYRESAKKEQTELYR